VTESESNGASVSIEKRLDTVHDHYKETVALIRDREKQRDRSFLVVILLYAVLVFQVQYPASFLNSLGTMSVAGGQLQVSRLPLPALLDVTWVLVLAVTLTYCRAAINIERQYAYLHRLEEWLSAKLQTPGLYRREGRVYLKGYPVFLDWAWICYVVIFPVTLLIGTTGLIFVEWQSSPSAVFHKLFDSGIGLTVVVSIVLYRVVPMVRERRRR
jgi:hypothetical protein